MIQENTPDRQMDQTNSQTDISSRQIRQTEQKDQTNTPDRQMDQTGIPDRQNRKIK